MVLACTEAFAGLIETPVAGLPTSGASGISRIVTDGTDGADCTVGGGNFAVLCTFDGSSTWTAGGGGGGGAALPIDLEADVENTLPVENGGTGLATIAENEMMLGTAADTLAAKALPSCSNATTSKMLYNSTTHAWSCGTDQDSGGAGSATYAISTKITTYTILTTDRVILCDATAGSFVMTLPAVSGNDGVNYVVKKIDSSANVCEVDANGSETIDGATGLQLGTQYEAVNLVADSTGWHIF
jgi:hypothetical protein